MQAYSQVSDHKLLELARVYEGAGDYQNAVASYKDYLSEPAPASTETTQARLKLAVLQDAISNTAESELSLILNALNLRADGDYEPAHAQLSTLIDSYPDSPLSDDAWYLRAYIALMDQYDFTRAITLFQTLQLKYPDSTYIDKALYAQAIAMEQLGNSDGALTTLQQLKNRHTDFSSPAVGQSLGTYLSRTWHERSTERIHNLQKRVVQATQLLDIGAANMDGHQWRADLMVEGQVVTVLINESGIIDGLKFEHNSDHASDSTLIAYSGVVLDEPESWVRITITDDQVRGMLSVNGELRELLPKTTGGSLGEIFNELHLDDADSYQSQLSTQALQTPNSGDKLNDYFRSIKAAEAFQLRPGVAGYVTSIGVVVDSKYNAYHNGHGREEALSVLNSVDGILQEQLGIALNVNSMVVLDDQANDPMNLGEVTMETMMRNFRDYRQASVDLGSDLAFATLFSGNRNSDTLQLGLAWIGSTCRDDGYDVSVVTPFKTPVFTSAKMIGNTLGAGSDLNTECSSQPYNIMWPFVSNRNTYTFSSCSIESIRQAMEESSCYVEAIDLAVVLGEFNDESMEVTISNEDSQLTATGATIKIIGSGVSGIAAQSNCTSADEFELTCTVETLPPLQSVNYRFDFNDSHTESAQFLISVEVDEFQDIHIHNNTIQIGDYSNTNVDSEPVNDSENVNNAPVIIDSTDSSNTIASPIDESNLGTDAEPDSDTNASAEDSHSDINPDMDATNLVTDNTLTTPAAKSGGGSIPPGVLFLLLAMHCLLLRRRRSDRWCCTFSDQLPCGNPLAVNHVQPGTNNNGNTYQAKSVREFVENQITEYGRNR